MGLSYSRFSFYEHFNRQFTYSFFYIQNRTMCLGQKILHQYFVGFFFALLGKTCHYIALNTYKPLENEMTDIQFIDFKSLCKAVGSASKRMQKP